MSIYYQDESSFEISQKVGRVLCQKWKKPIRTKWKERRHDGLSVSWVRSLDGKLCYRTSKTKLWKDFIKLLYKVKHKQKKKWIVLIVDNARIHRTKKLQKYCEERNILLVYLPPYSPDLNPIELLRKILKREFRKIQRLYDDIRKLVHLSATKIRPMISHCDIMNLVNII